MEMLEIRKGEKLSILNVKPISSIDNVPPRIVALGPYTFLIVYQGDWTKKEIRAIGERLTIDIAMIDDVIDIVTSFNNILEFDITYDVNITSPEIEFQRVEEDKGIAFHFVFLDCDTTVVYQRLVSLTTENSNAFVDALLEVKEKQYSREEYRRKTLDFFREYPLIKSIKDEAFIHQNFFKNR